MFGLSDADFGSPSGGAGLLSYFVQGAALPAQNGFFFVLMLVSLLGLVDYFAEKNKTLQGLSKKMSPVQGIAGVVLAVYSVIAIIMSFTLIVDSFMVFLSFFILAITAMALSVILGARFIFSFLSKNEKAVQQATKISSIGDSILFTLCWINLSAGFFMFLSFSGILLAVR